MPSTDAANAPNCLAAGAFGIGENHTEAAGRQLAIQLIEGGFVTRLFVELASSHYEGALANAIATRDNGGSFDEVRQYCPSGNLWTECPIPLAKVIATALLRNIPVHLADHHFMARQGDWSETRHRKIQEVFATATQQLPAPTANGTPACAGCLLLWGGSHFEGAHALDKYIIGLPFAILG